MKYVELINIGVQRMDIAHKIKALTEKAHMKYYMFNRICELGEFNKEEHILTSKNDFEKLITNGTKDINNSIKGYNKSASVIFKGSQIKEVQIKPIKNKIDMVFKKLDVDQEGYNLVSPYIEKELMGFINITFDKVFHDLISHKKETGHFSDSLNLDIYPDIYKDDLSQLVDLYILGYKSTSLLILGRIFEKLFTVWGTKLIQASVIEKTREEFEDLRFENILGLFKSLKLINEKDWLILSKLRIDRNIGGHYLSEDNVSIRIESEYESEMTIRLALPLIKKYHTLSEDLKTQAK